MSYHEFRYLDSSYPSKPIRASLPRSNAVMLHFQGLGQNYSSSTAVSVNCEDGLQPIGFGARAMCNGLTDFKVQRTASKILSMQLTMLLRQLHYSDDQAVTPSHHFCSFLTSVHSLMLCTQATLFVSLPQSIAFLILDTSMHNFVDCPLSTSYIAIRSIHRHTSPRSKLFFVIQALHLSCTVCCKIVLGVLAGHLCCATCQR